MLNVLVTAVGGDAGQGLVKSLRLMSEKVKIIGTDVEPEVPGLMMCDKGYIIAPAKEENKYVEDIVKICQQDQIDICLSAQPLELDVLSNRAEELRQRTKTYFVVQSKEVWDICQDKMKTFEYLRQHGIRTPQTVDTKDDAMALIQICGFPVVIKQRRGAGSRGFHIVHNEEEFKKFWDEVSMPIVQEYISDGTETEYTVGVFLDKNSKAIEAFAKLGKRRFGMTVFAKVDDFSDIREIAKKAAESVGAVGPCNVQLKIGKDNQPYVFEINARYSGTNIFRAKLGFNEAQAAIDCFIKNKKPILTYKKAVIFRVWDELIVPLEHYQELEQERKIDNSSIIS